MHEYTDCLVYATVFPTFDTNSSYWQIEVEEADRYNTAFIPAMYYIDSQEFPLD